MIITNTQPVRLVEFLEGENEVDYAVLGFAVEDDNTEAITPIVLGGIPEYNWAYCVDFAGPDAMPAASNFRFRLHPRLSTDDPAPGTVHHRLPDGGLVFQSLQEVRAYFGTTLKQTNARMVERMPLRTRKNATIRAAREAKKRPSTFRNYP